MQDGKSGLSWNSHTYISEAPESLVREDDMKGANEDMRRRFEQNCRRAALTNSTITFPNLNMAATV